jgi:hypothetical protein
MKTKLDEYEVERNEYTADYRLPAKNVMFYRDVILPFVENAFLMDSIARSENISYSKKDHGKSNKLKIRCFYRKISSATDGGSKDGSEWTELSASYEGLIGLAYKSDEGIFSDDAKVGYPHNFPLIVRPSEFGPAQTKPPSVNEIYEKLQECFTQSKVETNDPEICLPSEHAIYSILENFIRNGAKHNKERLVDQNFEVYFFVEDYEENDFFEVRLFDNVSSVDVSKLSAIVSGKLQDLLDESGDTRRENLGIADLKINAHLLMSREEIQDELLNRALQIEVKDYQLGEESKPDSWSFRESSIEEGLNRGLSREEIKKQVSTTLAKLEIKADKRVRKEKDNNGKETEVEWEFYQFGYRFKLAKSKKVCWIGKPDNVKLREKGIYCYDNWAAFEKASKSTLAAYQFAILELDKMKDWDCVRDGNETELDKRLQHLPGRVLVNCKEKECKSISILKEFSAQRRIQSVTTHIKTPTGDNLDTDLLKDCWENWLVRFVPKKSETDGTEKDSTEPLKKGLLVLYSDDGEIRSKWRPKSSKFESNRFSLDTKSAGNVGEPAVFWDHHGGSGVRTENWSFIGQNAYMSYGKSSPDHPYIYQSEVQKGKWLLPYELYESGLTKVLVVDERFTEFALQPISPDEFGFLTSTGGFGQGELLSRIDACWAANLFVATHIEGEPLKSETKGHTLNVQFERGKKPESNDEVLVLKAAGDFDPEKRLKDSKQIVLKEFDAIIIHRTYLNEAYKNTFRAGLEVEDFLFHLKRLIPQVYLTSGGSYPHGIGGNYKFVSFNELQRTVVNENGIGKNSLVSVLNNTTRNGNV